MSSAYQNSQDAQDDQDVVLPPPLSALFAANASNPPFMFPPLPSLAYTPSTSAPMDVYRDRDTNTMTRWKCVEKSLDTFFKLLPQVNVKVFLYDTETEMVTGTTEYLAKKIQSTRSGGGTSFDTCMTVLKSEWEKLTPERQSRVKKFIFTDGQDNGNKLFSITDPSNKMFQSFFDNVMAIGHTASFESSTQAMFSFFAGDRKDIVRFCESEDEVVQTIQGNCYAMLTSRITNVMFDVWMVNDEYFVAPDDAAVEYLTQEEWERHSEQDQDTATGLEYQYHNGVVILSPSVVQETAATATAATAATAAASEDSEYWLVVDKSGSMDEAIGNDRSSMRHNPAQIDPVKNPNPVVRVTMTVSAITPVSHIPLRGTVKGVWATFTDAEKHVQHGRIDAGSLHEEKTFDTIKVMLHLNDTLAVPMKKAQVQALYKEHFNFSHRVKKLPEWVRAQGEAVWKTVKARFIKTLKGLSADSFCQQSSIPLPMLMRVATSSAAETQSAAYEEKPVAFDDQDVCKICFTRPLGIRFTQCTHVCMCTQCYEENVLANPGDKVCPYCREEDIGHSTLKCDDGVSCIANCGRACAYVGECGHPLYCNTCKKDHVDATKCYDCPTCLRETKDASFAPGAKVRGISVLMC